MKKYVTLLIVNGGNADGVVTSEDVQRFLLGFNERFSLSDITVFINDVTVRQEGQLDFPEFVNLMARLVLIDKSDTVKSTDEDLLRTFEVR